MRAVGGDCDVALEIIHPVDEAEPTPLPVKPNFIVGEAASDHPVEVLICDEEAVRIGCEGNRVEGSGF